MSELRPAIAELVRLGPLPIEEDVTEEAQIARHEELLRELTQPVTDDEARALARLFPEHGTTFGLAWSLRHLIESAPGWPMRDVLDGPGSREWLDRLRTIARNSGYDV